MDDSIAEPVFEWVGADRELIPGSSVESFRISELDITPDTAEAVGAMGIVDHTAAAEKHKRLSITWCASTVVSARGVSPDWLVRKDRQKVRFCAGSFHDALCLFIREELAGYMQKRSSPKPGNAPSAPQQELLQNYWAYWIETPRCACRRIEASHPHNIFDWKRSDDSSGFWRMDGNYRCVVCDCGERWWLRRPDRDLWIRVPDDDAWNELIRNDGQMYKEFASFPDGIYLLATIQKKSFWAKSFVGDSAF